MKFTPKNRSIAAAVTFALALALMAGPLLGQSNSEPAKSIQLADVALPPELDRVLRDYERAWLAGDAEALSQLFAEDGFVLQSNRLPVRGRPAIRAAYDGQGSALLQLRALAFAIDGTIGYIIGGYRFGDSVGDTGKFTLTLRRAADGRWLIVSDMDNVNASPKRSPAPAPASSTKPDSAER